MSKLREFVKYAEEHYSALHNNETWLYTAKALLAEEEKEKPTAPDSLVEEIKEYTKKHEYMLWDGLYQILNRYQPEEKPTPAAEVEPLVKLAERKGVVLTPAKITSKGVDVEYIIFPYSGVVPGLNLLVFRAPTQSSAESDCREYLNGLPDRGGEGK
jgi:hypothetical protein